MNLKIHSVGEKYIAELESEKVVISELQDAIDLMADAGQLGAMGILVYEYQIAPEFFKLSTGFAGEILQKFSNYRMKLAIIGDFSKYQGRSLRDFIFESNKHRQVMFLPSRDSALHEMLK